MPPWLTGQQEAQDAPSLCGQEADNMLAGLGGGGRGLAGWLAQGATSPWAAPACLLRPSVTFSKTTDNAWEGVLDSLVFPSSYSAL